MSKNNKKPSWGQGKHATEVRVLRP